MKVAVISWDMGHNPVGRAFVIADMLAVHHEVELIGPLFERYGGAIWSPLLGSSLAIKTFKAAETSAFFDQADTFAETVKADLVIACKARLPSIYLGIQIARLNKCPLFIDVDDHELSFFKASFPYKIGPNWSFEKPSQPEPPFGQFWTQICDPLISSFDQIIVSNHALQRRFGGSIVRHARDERLFVFNHDIRKTVRAEFGYKETDKIILFLGTPRAHKGIFRIAQALETLSNPSLALCVIGSPNDKRVEKQLLSYTNARINLFPDQPWHRLPELVHLADGVCLLQDPQSPIAAYQIPAKLTDSLALGIPTAVSDVPPFSDIPSPEVVYRIRRDEDLLRFLSNVAERKFNPKAPSSQKRVDAFLSDFSYSANIKRLDALISSKSEFSMKESWATLLAAVDHYYGRGIKKVAAGAFRKPSKRTPPYDVVLFWKQNDTGIYGRRHDMLSLQMCEHRSFGKVLQIDAPISVDDLIRKLRFDKDQHFDQSNVVASSTIARWLGVDDRSSLIRKTFIFAGEKHTELLGRTLPARSEYVAWVKQCVSDFRGGNPLVAWVAPVVDDFPEMLDTIPFDITVADIIDDQRAMALDPRAKQRLDQLYMETLSRVDFVIANCESAKVGFESYRKDITVIPNAAESRVNGHRPVSTRKELAALGRTIIGYVGNLRDRIDVELLEKLSETRPQWTIVLIGSAHGQPEALKLRSRANVHFLGVKRSQDALNYIKCFDVAIMPHMDNEISQAMNPLKLYVYASAGVPIVTTNVANISDVSRFARVAKSHDDFIEQVDNILLSRTRTRDVSPTPVDLTWESRIEDVLSVLNGAYARWLSR